MNEQARQQAVFYGFCPKFLVEFWSWLPSLKDYDQQCKSNKYFPFLRCFWSWCLSKIQKERKHTVSQKRQQQQLYYTWMFCDYKDSQSLCRSTEYGLLTASLLVAFTCSFFRKQVFPNRQLLCYASWKLHMIGLVWSENSRRDTSISKNN